MSSTLNHSYYRVRLSPHGRQQTSMWVITADFTCSQAANDSRRQVTRGDVKGTREKSIKAKPTLNTRRLHIFFVPFMFLVVYFNITLAQCAWMALSLIEFIFMINVFFFPSPCCFSLVETSFYPNSFRSPFISYLFIICFTFFAFSMRRPSILKGKEELKVESSRLSFREMNHCEGNHLEQDLEEKKCLSDLTKFDKNFFVAHEMCHYKL